MDPTAVLNIAKQCQEAARHFGDRQNRDTTLTPKECQEIVTRFLNAGNVLETVAKQLQESK